MSNPDHLGQLEQALRYNDYVMTPNGKMAFEWELAGPDGARFRLLREPKHTADDVRIAKNELKRNRDVVGNIAILNLDI
jgi:hypothetical protein